MPPPLVRDRRYLVFVSWENWALPLRVMYRPATHSTSGPYFPALIWPWEIEVQVGPVTLWVFGGYCRPILERQDAKAAR